MNQDISSILCTQRWRHPPPEFLERVLSTALEASQTSAITPKGKPHALTWLVFIPRPLRLPLAACWLLAFFFRATTPGPIPQATLNSYTKLPTLTPAQLLANRKQIEQLADELFHNRHHGHVPPL